MFAKRVDPAALPLGSTRSRTQIAFSRQRRFAVAEIHGVESPKRGAEFHFPQICTTLERNACFFHKWPSRLRGGGGFTPLLADVVGGFTPLLADVFSIKNVQLSQFSGSRPSKTRNCRHFQFLNHQKCETVVKLRVLGAKVRSEF